MKYFLDQRKIVIVLWIVYQFEPENTIQHWLPPTKALSKRPQWKRSKIWQKVFNNARSFPPQVAFFLLLCCTSSLWMSGHMPLECHWPTQHIRICLLQEGVRRFPGSFSMCACGCSHKDTSQDPCVTPGTCPSLCGRAMPWLQLWKQGTQSQGLGLVQYTSSECIVVLFTSSNLAGEENVWWMRRVWKRQNKKHSLTEPETKLRKVHWHNNLKLKRLKCRMVTKEW